MLNFKKYIIESFDTVSDFLLNPENRDKGWEILLKEFKKSGGEVIGQGKYGKVFKHPNWNYILKMYTDEYYTRFVRFAFANPHSAFPRFYGPPQRIVPFYKRYPSQAIVYLVRMEELFPIDENTFKIIDSNDNLFKGMKYIYALKAGLNTDTEEYKHVINLLKHYPNLFKLFEGYYILLESKLVGAFDHHKNNYMKRRNGEIVMIDPLWGGSSPYADYVRMMDMETDALGYKFFDHEPPPTLIGGELPKKKRRRKVKPKSYTNSSDIPF